MGRVLIRDVMTTDVHSVRKTTPFKDIARILAGRGISALPVADDECTVVGVVSEADLLHKEIDPAPPRLVARFSRRRAKGAGRVAADLMTAPAVTIDADASIVEGARRMLDNGVKRLPVVDRYGKLVGIVSRWDLVRLFARADDELREEIVHDVLERALCLPPAEATAAVAVTDGVVTLTGRLERKSLVPITVSLTRRVPGVVDVVDHLTFAMDDTHLKPAEPGDYGVTHDLWHQR